MSSDLPKQGMSTAGMLRDHAYLSNGMVSSLVRVIAYIAGSGVGPLASVLDGLSVVESLVQKGLRTTGSLSPSLPGTSSTGSSSAVINSRITTGGSGDSSSVSGVLVDDPTVSTPATNSPLLIVSY